MKNKPLKTNLIVNIMWLTTIVAMSLIIGPVVLGASLWLIIPSGFLGICLLFIVFTIEASSEYQEMLRKK